MDVVGEGVGLSRHRSMIQEVEDAEKCDVDADCPEKDEEDEVCALVLT